MKTNAAELSALYLHSQMYCEESTPIVAVQSLVSLTLLSKPSDFLNLTKPDNRLSDSLIRLTCSTVKPRFSKSVLIAASVFTMSSPLNLELHEVANAKRRTITPARSDNGFITPTSTAVWLGRQSSGKITRVMGKD